MYSTSVFLLLLVINVAYVYCRPGLMKHDDEIYFGGPSNKRNQFGDKNDNENIFFGSSGSSQQTTARSQNKPDLGGTTNNYVGIFFGSTNSPQSSNRDQSKPDASGSRGGFSLTSFDDNNDKSSNSNQQSTSNGNFQSNSNNNFQSNSNNFQPNSNNNNAVSNSQQLINNYEPGMGEVNGLAERGIQIGAKAVEEVGSFSGNPGHVGESISHQINEGTSYIPGGSVIEEIPHVVPVSGEEKKETFTERIVKGAKNAVDRVADLTTHTTHTVATGIKRAIHTIATNPVYPLVRPEMVQYLLLTNIAHGSGPEECKCDVKRL